MIDLQTLTISYGKKVLVDSVNAEFAPGTVYGLVAPNGHGKTTLLRAMAGLPGPRVDGSIVLDEVQGTGAREVRSMIFYAPGEGTLLYPGGSGANADRRVREDEDPRSEPGYEAAAYLGDCVCDGCAVPPVG